MAGRFFRGEIGWEAYAARISLQAPKDVMPPPLQANIAPSMMVPVIRYIPEGDGERMQLHLGPTLWGLIPDWFRGRFEEWKRPAFNARAEDVAESAVFRGAFRHRRCLIPAHGYYLWEGEKGQKIRYAVGRRDGDWFCFAGVWERALIDGSVYDGVAMLTTTPNDTVAGLSERMPVILPPEAYASWLMDTPRQIVQLLRAYPAANMVAWPSQEGYPVWPDI